MIYPEDGIDIETLAALYRCVRELVAERDHLSEIVECLTGFTLRCGMVAKEGKDPQQDLMAQAMHARLSDLVLAHLQATEAPDN